MGTKKPLTKEQLAARRKEANARVLADYQLTANVVVPVEHRAVRSTAEIVSMKAAIAKLTKTLGV